MNPTTDQKEKAEKILDAFRLYNKHENIVWKGNFEFTSEGELKYWIVPYIKGVNKPDGRLNWQSFARLSLQELLGEPVKVAYNLAVKYANSWEHDLITDDVPGSRPQQPFYIQFYKDNEKTDWCLYISTLKEICKDRKITDARLAEMVGMQRAAITRFFSAKYCPKLDTFLKIANALKVYFIIDGPETIEEVFS